MNETEDELKSRHRAEQEELKESLRDRGASDYQRSIETGDLSADHGAETLAWKVNHRFERLEARIVRIESKLSLREGGQD
ncbi:hypothetical protein BH09CHL1_BH09CHL1_06570 [soil metagenome]